MSETRPPMPSAVPENMDPAAQHQPEPEQESRFGKHARRVLVGTTLATGLVSLVQGVAEAPEAPWTYTQGFSYSTNPGVWTRHLEQGTTQTSETKTTQVNLGSSDTANIMPWAKDFRLTSGNGDSDTARLENAGAFREFIDDVAEKTAKGASITDVYVIGFSSDEVERPDGGLGKKEPENKQLAVDRGEFFADEVVAGLAKRGVSVDAVTVEGYEQTLNETEIAQVTAIAARHKQADNLGAFLRKYNTKQIKLSASEQKTLDKLFKERRGPTAWVTLSTTETTVTPGETTDVCSDVYELHKTRKHHGGEIPLTVVPFYLPGRRRKDPNTPEVPEQPAPNEEAPIAEDKPKPVSTYAERAAAYHRDVDNWIFYVDRRIKELRAENPRMPYYEAYEQARATQPPRPKEADYFDPKRWQRRSILAGIALASAAVISPQLGYCPEPAEIHQVPKWEANLPEHVGFRLRIPFTDIKTPELVFTEAICIDPNKSTAKGKTCEPTQKVTRIYQDGKLVDTQTYTIRTGR